MGVDVTEEPNAWRGSIRDMTTRALSLVVTVLAVAAAACMPAGLADRADAPPPRALPQPSVLDGVEELRRPLRAADGPDSGCSADRGVYAAEFPGARGFVPGVGYVAFGRGPVAPAIHTTPDAAILSFTSMPKQDGFAFEKIIWLVAPGTSGPILVRAIGADGTRARFMTGDTRAPGPEDLRLPGPGTHPEGYVYFPVPGCYTFQADHPGGTHRITILVR